MKGININEERFSGSLEINDSYEGETIENKVERVTTLNEPISDGAPLIYSERKEGVLPEYNIRTDKWDIAVEAMGAVTKAQLAKRNETPSNGDMLGDPSQPTEQ